MYHRIYFGDSTGELGNHLCRIFVVWLTQTAGSETQILERCISIGVIQKVIFYLMKHLLQIASPFVLSIFKILMSSLYGKTPNQNKQTLSTAVDTDTHSLILIDLVLFILEAIL